MSIVYKILTTSYFIFFSFYTMSSKFSGLFTLAMHLSLFAVLSAVGGKCNPTRTIKLHFVEKKFYINSVLRFIF